MRVRVCVYLCMCVCECVGEGCWGKRKEEGRENILEKGGDSQRGLMSVIGPSNVKGQQWGAKGRGVEMTLSRLGTGPGQRA